MSPLPTMKAKHDFMFATVFHCNEISRAVLLRSEHELATAISRSPHSINEPNAMGQTPLHLSVEWPLGIKTLIEAGANVNRDDIAGETPIIYACQCQLVETTRLLADAGCDLILPPLLASKASTSVLGFALDREHRATWSSPCAASTCAIIDCLIESLVKRRKALQILISTLPDLPLLDSRVLLPDRVLDAYAGEACSILKAHRITIPPSLWPDAFQRTVYHLSNLSLRSADLLWDAGFRDIDGFDVFGTTPLMRPVGNRYRSLQEYLQMVEWFLSRGADLCKAARKADGLQTLWEQVNQGRLIDENRLEIGVTTLHFVTHNIAIKMLEEIASQLPIFQGFQFLRRHVQTMNSPSQGLLCKVIAYAVQDRCTCACSLAGCTGLLLVLKNFGYTLRTGPHATEPAMAQKWLFLVSELLIETMRQTEESGEPLYDRLILDAIRFLTFEGLELRHTCCYCDGNWYSTYDDNEERLEIWEEDKLRLAQLEKLIPEFEGKWCELSIPFLQFMKEYWQPRMDQAIQEWEEINEQELRRIGVIVEETAFEGGEFVSEDEEDGCPEYYCLGDDDQGESLTER